MFSNYIPKTELEKIILCYPSKPWNTSYLSTNPNVSYQLLELLKLKKAVNHSLLVNKFISKNNLKSWDWTSLCRFCGYKNIDNLSLINFTPIPFEKWDFYVIFSSPNTQLEFIENNMEYVNWFALSINPNLDSKFIDKHIDKDWVWYLLSKNRGVTLSLLKKYRDKPWDLSYLAYNPNLTIKWVLYIYNYYHEELKTAYLFWDGVSSHKKILVSDIRKYKSLPWNWKNISKNPNIDFKFISENLGSNWCWNSLSAHKNITMDIIKNNPHLPWNYRFISDNPNITNTFIYENCLKLNFQKLSLNNNLDVNLVENLINYDWNFNYLSTHPNLNLDIVSKTIFKPWNWNYISYHPKFSPFLLKKNKELPITIEALCSNSNISLEFIKTIADKMTPNDWQILSCNPFKYDNINKTIDYGYNEWRFLETIIKLNKYKEELITKTWHPIRINDWCLDIVDVKELTI